MPDDGSQPGGDNYRPPNSIDWDEIDQLLVFGERITDPVTGLLVTHFPSQREIADRYGVGVASVGRFSKKNRIMARRAEAQATRREKQARVVAKHREERDTKIAKLSVEEEVEIIDAYLIAFAEGLREGRVDADNPADFNLMVRLKRFVQGEADARAEIRTILSLDALRERHERQQARVSQANKATTGMEGEDEPPEPRGPRALPPACEESEVIDVEAVDVEEATGTDDSA